MNSDTFTKDENQVIIQWPAKMSPESYEDFKSWFDWSQVKRSEQRIT